MERAAKLEAELGWRILLRNHRSMSKYMVSVCL